MNEKTFIELLLFVYKAIKARIVRLRESMYLHIIVEYRSTLRIVREMGKGYS